MRAYCIPLPGGHAAGSAVSFDGPVHSGTRGSSGPGGEVCVEQTGADLAVL